MPTTTDTKAQGKQKARKTIDCYPEKAEYRTKTAGRLCLEYVEKKLTLLATRKDKMDVHKEKLDRGEPLDQTALDSLEKYDKICHDHYVTEGIYKRLKDITDKHKKTMEDMNRKEAERIEEVLKLQYTLDQFGGDSVREDFIKGKRGAVLLTQDNLDQLDALYQVISPTKNGASNQEKGKNKDPTQMYTAASEHLVKYLDGEDSDVVGTTYKNLKKLVSQINKCGYFKRLQRIQATETEKSGDQAKEGEDGKRSKKQRQRMKKRGDTDSEDKESQSATEQMSEKSVEPAENNKVAQQSEDHKATPLNTVEQDAFFAPSSSPYQQSSSTSDSVGASFSSQSAISSTDNTTAANSQQQPDIQSFTHNRPFQFIQTSYVLPDSTSPSVFDPAVIVAQPAGGYGLQFMSPLYDTPGVASTNSSVGQQQPPQQQQQQTQPQPSSQQPPQHQQQQHHQHHQSQPAQPQQPPHQLQTTPAPGLTALSSQQPQITPSMAPSAPSVNPLGMPVDLSQGPVDLSQSSAVKQQQQQQQHPTQQEFNVQSNFPQSESLFSNPSVSHPSEMSSTAKMSGGNNHSHSDSRGPSGTGNALREEAIASINNYDIPPSIPMPPSQQEPGQEPQEKKSPMNANAPVFQSMYTQQSGGNHHQQVPMPPHQQQQPPSDIQVPHTQSDYMPNNTFGGPSGDFVGANDFQSGYQGSNGFANGNYGRGGMGGNRGGYRGPRGGNAGTGGPGNNMNSRNGGNSYQNYGGPNSGYRSDNNFQSSSYGSNSFGGNNANNYIKRGGMNTGMGGPANSGYPPRSTGMGPNPNRGAMRGGMPRGGPRGGPHRGGFGRPQ